MITQKSGKTRRLIRNRDGTFLGSPGNSDPDEIIYASEAQIISRSVSPAGLINPGKDAITMRIAIEVEYLLFPLLQRTCRGRYNQVKSFSACKKMNFNPINPTPFA